jgi:two-component system, chemotaxis family, sensor kinase Cph1
MIAPMETRKLKRGDHVCAVYSTRAELADMVADYIVDGLERRQRCWFITPGDEAADVRAALLRRHVDVDSQTARGALQLISGPDTYVVHGAFEPERAIQTFNEAIDRAYRDGFTGFRAAAEMSWAMTDADRMQQLIIYEALLKALFSTSRATGLCLFDRTRTPLHVIGGALATHPVVRTDDGYAANPFYDEAVTGLALVKPEEVPAKLATLERGRNVNLSGSRPVT